MSRNQNIIDSKPKNYVSDTKPLNSQAFDAKPKSNIDDDNFNEGETVTTTLTVGGWMGSPFITYTVAQTLTFEQPKGGRAGN